MIRAYEIEKDSSVRLALYVPRGGLMCAKLAVSVFRGVCNQIASLKVEPGQNGHYNCEGLVNLVGFRTCRAFIVGSAVGGTEL